MMRSKGLFLVAFLICAGTLAQAGIADLTTLRNRVSQMSFAACMVMADLNPKTNAALIFDAALQVEAGMANGSVRDPERPEGDISEPWQQFVPAVQQLAAHDFHSFVIQQYLREGPRLVARIEARMQAKLDAQTAAEMRVAASIRRLSKLSQTIGTHMCLISMDIDTDLSRSALARDVAAFETGLLALEEGDAAAGIPPPEDMDYEDQLWMLRGEWDALAEALESEGAATGVSRDALVSLSEMIGVLFVTCEDTLRIYAGGSDLSF